MSTDVARWFIWWTSPYLKVYASEDKNWVNSEQSFPSLWAQEGRKELAFKIQFILIFLPVYWHYLIFLLMYCWISLLIQWSKTWLIIINNEESPEADIMKNSYFRNIRSRDRTVINPSSKLSKWQNNGISFLSRPLICEQARPVCIVT